MAAPNLAEIPNEAADLVARGLTCPDLQRLALTDRRYAGIAGRYRATVCADPDAAPEQLEWLTSRFLVGALVNALRRSITLPSEEIVRVGGTPDADLWRAGIRRLHVLTTDVDDPDGSFITVIDMVAGNSMLVDGDVLLRVAAGAEGELAIVAPAFDALAPGGAGTLADWQMLLDDGASAVGAAFVAVLMRVLRSPAGATFAFLRNDDGFTLAGDAIHGAVTDAALVESADEGIVVAGGAAVTLLASTVPGGTAAMFRTGAGARLARLARAPTYGRAQTELMRYLMTMADAAPPVSLQASAWLGDMTAHVARATVASDVQRIGLMLRAIYLDVHPFRYERWVAANDGGAMEAYLDAMDGVGPSTRWVQQLAYAPLAPSGRLTIADRETLATWRGDHGLLAAPPTAAAPVLPAASLPSTLFAGATGGGVITATYRTDVGSANRTRSVRIDALTDADRRELRAAIGEYRRWRRDGVAYSSVTLKVDSKTYPLDPELTPRLFRFARRLLGKLENDPGW